MPKIEHTQITNIEDTGDGYWINHEELAFWCNKEKFIKEPKIGDSLEIHTVIWCVITKCLHNGHLIIDNT